MQNLRNSNIYLLILLKKKNCYSEMLIHSSSTKCPNQNDVDEKKTKNFVYTLILISLRIHKNFIH